MGESNANKEEVKSWPIDEKSEPLLASLKRLGILTKAEEEYITSYDPMRWDHPVCRLEYVNDIPRTTRVVKTSGGQIRMAQAIIIGVGAQADSEKDPKAPKLDEQAKKELKATMLDYPVVTHDDKGLILDARKVRGDAEAMKWAYIDAKGAAHFRMLLKKAREAQKEKDGTVDRDKAETGTKNVGENEQSSVLPLNSLENNLRALSDMRNAAEELQLAMGGITSPARDAKSLPYNEAAGKTAKVAVS